MYDWSKAYDNQDHTLGIQSFIDNNVRNCLIPILISYLQDRKMIVKWNEAKSDIKDLPGGGAQGTLIGPLEYFSQSNNSSNIVPITDRFKFVDDLSVIEIIQLASKIISHNFKLNVASDIGLHGQYIDGASLNSQIYTESIQEWTKNQQMVLNEKKNQIYGLQFH